MHYILVFILLTASIYAKTTDFSITIKKPFNDTLVDVTQDYDRSISAIGYVKRYKTSSAKTTSTYTNAFDYLSSLSNSYGSEIHLVKVDNKANIKLSKSINLPNFNKAVSIHKTPSNGYFVGGYSNDGLLIILKLDSNANKIFSKTFGTANTDKMNKLIILRDGGVLIIASSKTTRSQHDDIFETGLGLNDIYISKFTKDGIKLWSKKYGTEYDDSGIDAVEANDGSIIVLGTTSYGNIKNISIMRIGENGNKIWLKHHKSDKAITPQKIIKLRDNNFLISLTQKDEMNKDQIRLIKFDIQNNTLIDKSIHTAYSSALKDIKEYSDSKIIGVGYVQDSYNTDGLVMLLDSNLKMLVQEHYGGENFDFFNAISILHNSKAAIVGLNTDKNSQESNMWILKLNKDLSIAQVSNGVKSFYEELLSVFKDDILENKIAIKEDLSIEFIDTNLYFKTGEYKLNSKQKDYLEKFSSKIMPYLHKYKEFIDTLEISGHTSSEWGDANFSNSFLKNEKLSMNRSYTTLAYIFKNQDELTKRWLSNVIKGSGLGFSKKITFNDIEDKQKSRRVSFKIILNN